MQARAARFTCKLVLVSVIISSTIGTALVAQCLERLAISRPSDSSECAYIIDILNLQEVFALDHCHKIPTCRIPSDEVGANLQLFGGFLGTAINPISTLEKREIGLYDFNKLCTMIIDSRSVNMKDDVPVPHLPEEKETVAEISAEPSSNSIDTTETQPGQETEESGDTERPNTPKQVLTRVRTKIKSIETILKKAVLESYHINGQIQGLRITGLEKILAAQELLLKSGDIIRVVNGQPLISKKEAYKIFKKARNLPIMEIELLRDGESQTLLYYLK